MAKSECAQCGRVFGGLTGFDAHQDWHVWKSLGPELRLVCRDPAELGYVFLGGVWRLPSRSDAPWKPSRRENQAISGVEGTRT